MTRRSQAGRGPKSKCLGRGNSQCQGPRCGVSLVVQCKNLPCSARDTGSIPGSGSPLMPRGATTADPALWSPRAATTEAYRPESLCSPREDPATRGPRAATKTQRSHKINVSFKKALGYPCACMLSCSVVANSLQLSGL